MSVDSKFGIKKYLTQAEVFAPDVDIFNDSKIKIIVGNAGVTNVINVYGRIQGQKTWDLIDSITGNGTKDFNVKLFDFVRLDCTVFDSTGRVEVTGSGFNNVSGGGLESISTPSGDLSDLETLEFTSSDNSVLIQGIAPNIVDFKISGSAGNAFGRINTPDSNVSIADSFSDNLYLTQSNDSVVITSNPVTDTVNFDIVPRIKDNVVVTEKFTLTATDITNKYVALSNIVYTPFKTRLTIHGGPEQKILDDFTVSGNLLGWGGTSLDGVLEEGEELTITHD